MQKWEYHTVSLMPVKSLGGRVKKWKLTKVNEEDNPNWYKDEHSSLRVFCNQMGQGGWELVNTSPSEDGLLLFFKRPLE